MNTILRQTGVSFLLALMIPGAAMASDFDGSKNLLCAAIDVVACTEGDQGPSCLQGNSRSFDLAEFFSVDFTKQEIRATGNNVDKVSPIMNQDKTKTQLVMQGVENDRGWTAAVNEKNGDLALAVAGKDVSFMIFGACSAL